MNDRKMAPRIPSMSVLDSCRPSYAKDSRKSEIGECSLYNSRTSINLCLSML